MHSLSNAKNMEYLYINNTVKLVSLLKAYLNHFHWLIKHNLELFTYSNLC